MTSWSDIQSRVIFRSTVGSNLFGTADAASDLDLRAVWVGLPLHPGPAVVHNPGAKDDHAIEVRELARRLIAGDNNALEILHGADPSMDLAFLPLHAMRQSFASRAWGKKCLGFAGYVAHAQGKPGFGRELAHAVRVLWTCRARILLGAYEPNLTKAGWTYEERAELRAIARNEGAPSDVKQYKEWLGELRADVEAGLERLPELDPVPLQRALRDLLYTTNKDLG